MKRLFFLLCCLFYVVLSTYSQNKLNEAQLRLRTNLEIFLREEGFMPTIDEDGDIEFKKEGEKYYVMIDERDTSPFFVRISRFYNYSGKFSKQNIANNLFELNLYKGVKILCFENTYAYQAQMYLINAENFKHVFYKLMEQLEALEKNTSELCSNDNNNSTSSRLTLDNMFPVNGVTIGEFTINQAEKVTKVDKEDTYNWCRIGSSGEYLSLYDNDKNGVFEEVLLFEGNVVPSKWRNLGIDLDASWNEWKTYIENNGYVITSDKHEIKTTSDNRKYLYGTISAESVSTGLKITCYFSDRSDSHGTSLDSRKTLRFFGVFKL